MTKTTYPRFSRVQAATTRRGFFKSALVTSGVALATCVPLFSAQFASASSARATLVNPVPLYRLYNPSSADHLYSFSSTEGTPSSLYEEIACHIFAQRSGQQPGTAQFYRLFGGGGDHFYTADPQEALDAEKEGYTFEANYGWVYPSITAQPGGTTPLFRLYNWHTGRHFYTTNSTERTQALEQGFSDEGIACYVYP